MSRAIQETIFWTHVVAIPLAMSIGFFLPFWLVVAAVAVHRAHVHLMGECALTRVERIAGALAVDSVFLQKAAARIFRKNISVRQGKHLDYAFALTPVVVAGVLTLPVI